MTKTQRDYKRLPGKGKSFLIGSSTLWLGTDHLLSMDSKRVSEDYKRFYYGDIQSISIRKTVIGKIQNLFLGLFCGFFTMAHVFTQEAWSTFFATIAGLFLLVLLINWWRGPTCVCYLQTGVQTDKLPSLHRLRAARKAMNLLRPLIEKAQGRLTPEQFKAGTSDRPRMATQTSKGYATVQSQRHGHGRFHKLLFSLLLIGGIFAAVDLSCGDVAITLMASAISMATGVCVIIALVKQHSGYTTGALRAITWATLGCVCLDFFFSYVLCVVISIRNPEAMNNQWELIKLVSAMSKTDSLLLTGIYIFSMAYSFGLGICGLILLRRLQQEHEFSPAMPTTLSGAEALSLQV